MRELIGHQHLSCAGFARNGRGQQTHGPSAQHGYAIARANLNQFQHMHDHGYRFNERGLRVAETFRYKRGVVSWDGGVFTQESGQLRRTHEQPAHAIVVMPAETIFAMAATDGRLDGHAIAWL